VPLRHANRLGREACTSGFLRRTCGGRRKPPSWALAARIAFANDEVQTLMPATAIESSVREATRLGLTFPADPYASTTWSGTPAGLIKGLHACGVTVSGIGLQLPLVLHRTVLGASALVRLRPPSRGSRNVLHDALARARVAPSQGRIETLLARRRLRGPRLFDAIVQLGTGYSLPPATSVVTLEDMTVPLAHQLGFEGYGDLSPRALAARRAAQARAYANAVACCATSAWAAESIVSDYGIPPDRVHVVGVGANHRPRTVERDWSRPRFLFIGSDWHGKNGDAVLRAFTLLRESWPNAHLDVAGHHPRMDLPGVSTHGWLHPDRALDRGRIEQLFENATCLVMPSHREAMGIVYAEASSAGIASIGTKAGGGSQIIGHTGRVVDPEDDAELLDAMRELAEPERARELGALAHDRSRLFTWQAVAERLLRALGLPGVDMENLAEFLEPVGLATR
jgi:glycosyltransferase involved in cell wall biosynthesis